MIYSSETKQELDMILDIFRPYIEENPYFDIVYSDKIGYVQIDISPDFEPSRIRSAEHLLDTLLVQLAMDDPFSPEMWKTGDFTPASADRIRRRVLPLLEGQGRSGKSMPPSLSAP